MRGCFVRSCVGFFQNGQVRWIVPPESNDIDDVRDTFSLTSSGTVYYGICSENIIAPFLASHAFSSSVSLFWIDTSVESHIHQSSLIIDF